MTVSHGKPYAGNLHVRFDEGAGVPSLTVAYLSRNSDKDVMLVESNTTFAVLDSTINNFNITYTVLKLYKKISTLATLC